MILKFCDVCMAHVAKHTLVMPRNVVTKVQGGKNNVTLMQYRHTKDFSTDLCQSCYDLIANIFPDVTDDKKDDEVFHDIIDKVNAVGNVNAVATKEIGEN